MEDAANFQPQLCIMGYLEYLKFWKSLCYYIFNIMTIYFLVIPFFIFLSGLEMKLVCRILNFPSHLVWGAHSEIRKTSSKLNASIDKSSEVWFVFIYILFILFLFLLFFIFPGFCKRWNTILCRTHKGEIKIYENI